MGQGPRYVEPSTWENLADLFAGIEGLGRGLQVYGEQKRRKTQQKTDLVVTLANATPEQRKAILAAYTDKELKELGIPRNFQQDLDPMETAARGRAAIESRLLPLTERATTEQLEQGIKQGALSTQRLQQMVDAGQIDLEDAKTKTAMKQHPNRILAFAVGEGRSFAEAVQLANAESDPQGMLTEARTAMDTTPEGRTRKIGEYYKELGDKLPNMPKAEVLKLSRELANDNFDAIDKIPDKKLRTSAQIALADQLDRTNIQRKELSLAHERIIGSTALGLMKEYNLPTEAATRVAKATLSGQKLEGKDKEYLDKAQEMQNTLMAVELQKKQQELMQNPAQLAPLRNLYQDLLSKAGKKGVDADPATLQRIEKEYVKRVTEMMGMPPEAENSPYWKQLVVGLGQMGMELGKDAPEPMKIPEDMGRRFIGDLFGPEMIGFLDKFPEIVKPGTDAVGAIAGAGKTVLELASPQISYLSTGHELHPLIQKGMAYVPGFRMLIKANAERRVDELLAQANGALTEAQKTDLETQLQFYADLLKRTP